MNIKFRLFIIFLISLLITNCATYVDIKVLKPAKLDIGNKVKKIAVADFTFTGSWSFVQPEEPESLLDIAAEALKSLTGTKSKAKPLPDPYSAYPGKDISLRLTSKLVNNGYYEVLERDQLAELLEEHQLTMSGLTDENEAVKVGKLLGVDAIIFGEGSYSVNDDGGWYEKTGKTKDGKEYTYDVYKIFRLIDTQLNIRIVEVETGKIVASKTISKANYDESKLLFPYDTYSEGEDLEEVYELLDEWYPIVNDHVESIIGKMIKQIAPYYSTQQREIKKGNSKQMEVGLEYAKRGLWEDARESWEKVLTSKSKGAKEDRTSAKYNLGVYYECNGELDQAEILFKECFDESGDTTYLDARKRVQKRKAEIERLKEQQNE
ncbi:MAG: hypothetical protein H8E14_14125 [Candidatus Marinimicrobia bacterium]|nr:hypothetical protein [Candidatus Neomarinimicrobiota bacterium]